MAEDTKIEIPPPKPKGWYDKFIIIERILYCVCNLLHVLTYTGSKASSVKFPVLLELSLKQSKMFQNNF